MKERRDFTKRVAIIGGGEPGTLGILAAKLAEMDSGIEMVSLNDVKPPEPMVLQYNNPYRFDDLTVYNPSKKRGSNFTPKKKKRKKR